MQTFPLTFEFIPYFMLSDLHLFTPVIFVVEMTFRLGDALSEVLPSGAMGG